MNAIRVISATGLLLLLGLAAPAYTWQEKQEEKAKPAKQEHQAKPEKQQQAKAPRQEQQAKSEKQQQAKAPRQEQQAKSEKQQQAKAPRQEQRQQQDRSAKQQEVAKVEQNERGQQQAHSSRAPQRTQQAEARQRAQPALRLSTRGEGRISDARFRSNFGRQHGFRMGNPVLVGGYSRFHYGGYWFGFVDPWPSDWYYTDAVYIDYVDGGYYMYNPYYPGTRFAITVVI
jgi:hypothetical protein